MVYEFLLAGQPYLTQRTPNGILHSTFNQMFANERPIDGIDLVLFAALVALPTLGHLRQLLMHSRAMPHQTVFALETLATQGARVLVLGATVPTMRPQVLVPFELSAAHFALVLAW